MSRPSSSMTPESMGYTPAIMFMRVDLPAPLPPITVTKSPGARCRSTLTKARFSLMVPALKVLQTFCTFSMGYRPPSGRAARV